MYSRDIIIVDGVEDRCLRHMEESGLFPMMDLPDVIPIRNLHYEEDDSDTDEEEESRALVMGPHRSTIEFILDHLRKHGMNKKGVPAQYFQENVHPFAKEENLDSLYKEAFKKVYGYYPEEVLSTDYDMSKHPEYSKRGHIAPTTIPVTGDNKDAVMATLAPDDELVKTMDAIRLAAGGKGERGSFINDLLGSHYGRRRYY